MNRLQFENYKFQVNLDKLEFVEDCSEGFYDAVHVKG